MKKNKYLYILFTILILFSFSSNIKAESLDGYCIYHTKTKRILGDDLSFMIKQNKKGKITYYYYKGEKIETNTSKKWVKDTKNEYTYKLKDVSTPLESCPSFIDYSPEKKRLTFRNMAIGTNPPTEIENITPYKATISTSATTSSGTYEEPKIVTDEPVTLQSCEEILGEELISMLQDIVNIVKVLIPILLIVLGTLDFGKALLSSDENDMKKSQSKFIKRLIIAVAIFLIPSILGVILDIANNVWGNIDTTLCGIEF